MRHLAILLVCASGLCAQALDEKIQTDYEDLMELMRAPEGGKPLDEDAAKRRAEEFRGRLDRFISKWNGFTSEISTGRLHLGRALALAGRPQEAVPHFRHFVDKHATSEDIEEAIISLGTAHLDSGQYNDAGVVLSRFLRERPKSERRVVVEYYLGLTRWQQGVVDEALTRLDTVIGSGAELPVVADAQIKVIEILRDSGRIDEAKKRLDKLAVANSESRYLDSLKEQLSWIGKPAPELVSMDHWLKGKPLTIEGTRGRVVVINFFADRYESCQAELEALAKMHAGMQGDAVTFLGLTKYYRPLDRVPAKKQNENLDAFLNKHGVPFTVGVAKDFKNFRAYGVRGIPHTVVVGKDGSIVYVKTGGSRKNRRGLDTLKAAITRAAGG